MSSLLRPYLPVVVVVGALAGVATAGPASTSSPAALVAAALRKADAALATHDWRGVVIALDDAGRVARREAPLVVSAAEVVTGAHVGVGVYDKAVDGVVADKRLRLYVEVENPTASPLAGSVPGRFRHELDVVGRFFVVEDDKSLSPLGEKNLGRQTVDVWRPLVVHALGLDVTLGDAPAGPYVVEIVVTDVATGRSATRRVPFTLREQQGKR